MPDSRARDVTGLLLAWNAGEPGALDRLVPLVYAELRRLAHFQMRGERPAHTLQTTALVHEAYLRLVDESRTHWRNRAQLFAVAAQVMRRILVDGPSTAVGDDREAADEDVARARGVQRLAEADEVLGLRLACVRAIARMIHSSASAKVAKRWTPRGTSAPVPRSTASAEGPR